MIWFLLAAAFVVLWLLLATAIAAADQDDSLWDLVSLLALFAVASVTLPGLVETVRGQDIVADVASEPNFPNNAVLLTALALAILRCCRIVSRDPFRQALKGDVPIVRRYSAMQVVARLLLVALAAVVLALGIAGLYRYGGDALAVFETFDTCSDACNSARLQLLARVVLYGCLTLFGAIWLLFEPAGWSRRSTPALAQPSPE